MRRIFIGPGGLRPGWGFATFAVLWLAISTAFLLLGRLVYEGHPGMHPVDFLVSDGLGFLATLIAAAVMSRIEKRPLREDGLPLHAAAIRKLGWGLVWGTLAVVLLMLGIRLLGGVAFEGLALHGSELAGSAIVWGVSMIVLGFFEEFLFRGYPLVTLSRGIGFWPAAILLSAGFGALHFFTKPMETLADAAAVSFIALLVCFTILRTGDLWLAVGFHAAFDYFALAVFGAPNTANGGKPVTGRLLATRFQGPEWLTGGACGIEASFLIFPIIALLFWLLARQFPAPAGRRET